MRTRQFYLIKKLELLLIVAVFILAGTAQATFTIEGPTYHIPSVPLTGCPSPACTSATSTLNPDPVVYLDPPVNGSSFWNTFSADQSEYPGWTLDTGDPLSGTLSIINYLALDRNNCCGGARMQAVYQNDFENDPYPVTFIQMWYDNYSTGGNRHIDPNHNEPGENFTDTNGNGTWDPGEPFEDFGDDGKVNTGDCGEGDGKYNPPDTEPFYYTECERNACGTNFEDYPYNCCLSCPSFTWNRFDTYLCSWDDTTKVVTVHDGWRWGYDLNCVPEPATLLLLGLGGLALLRRRRR